MAPQIVTQRSISSSRNQTNSKGKQRTITSRYFKNQLPRRHSSIRERVRLAPVPIEPVPIEPIPIEPVPTEPVLTEPVPNEPTPFSLKKLAISAINQ